MAFDGVMMHYVKEEIKSVALDARVSQIHQPNRDELVIALRTKNGNKKLLVSSRGKFTTNLLYRTFYWKSCNTTNALYAT